MLTIAESTVFPSFKRTKVHHIALLGYLLYCQDIAVLQRQGGVVGQGEGLFLVQKDLSQHAFSQFTDLFGEGALRITCQEKPSQECNCPVASPGLIIKWLGPCVRRVNYLVFICQAAIHIYLELLSPLIPVQIVVKPAKVVCAPDAVATANMAPHVG